VHITGGKIRCGNTSATSIQTAGGVTCTTLTASGDVSIVAANGLTVRQTANQDGLRIQGRAAGTSGFNLTLTTGVALASDVTVYLPTVNGATVLATNSTPVAGCIPYSAGANYVAMLSGAFLFDEANLRLQVGTLTSTQNSVLHASGGASGSGTGRVRLGTAIRDWEIVAGASPYNLTISYTGTDAPLANILSMTKAGAATFIGALSATSLTATAFKSGTTQVVGAQGAAVADATDAATAITQLNALLARCRAHGLIA